MDERQAKLVVAKAEYRTALRNLESISEEIHAQRRSLAMGTREQGVGAEGDTGDADIANFKMESDGLSSEQNRSLKRTYPLQSDYDLFLFCFVGVSVCLHVQCTYLSVCVCVCSSGVRVH